MAHLPTTTPEDTVDNTPDPRDQPDDATRVIEPMQLPEPTPDRSTRTRKLLIGFIVAAPIGLAVIGLRLTGVWSEDTPVGDEAPGVVIQTGATSAGSVEQAVDSESSVASSTVAAAGPVTTLTTAPPQAGQPANPEPQAQLTPTPPPGHVDSCAYPDMDPTVVSGTTYTPAPTPTVTVVTSPATCPPYSAGYPWDGR